MILTWRLCWFALIAVASFDNAAKNVANSQNHSAGAGQGIWLKLAPPAGQAAGKEVYEIEEAGEST